MDSLIQGINISEALKNYVSVKGASDSDSLTEYLTLAKVIAKVVNDVENYPNYTEYGQLFKQGTEQGGLEYIKQLTDYKNSLAIIQTIGKHSSTTSTLTVSNSSSPLTQSSAQKKTKITLLVGREFLRIVFPVLKPKILLSANTIGWTLEDFESILEEIKSTLETQNELSKLIWGADLRKTLQTNSLARKQNAANRILQYQTEESTTNSIVEVIEDHDPDSNVNNNKLVTNEDNVKNSSS